MRLLKSKLVVSCIIIYLTAASLSLYIPVLAPLLLGGSGSISMAATSSEARQLLYAAAVTAPQVFSAIGAPLCGALSDRYGRRRSLIATLSGALAAMSVCAIAIVLHQVYLLVVGLALIGLMDGSGVIVQAGLLEETPPDQHASAVGKLTACSVVGLVSGPLIGGVCSDQRLLPFSTYYLPFIVTSLLFALAVGIVLAYYSEGTRGAALDRSESGRYLSDLIATIRPPQIRRFACLFFLLEIVIGCFYQRLPLLLQQNNAGPSIIGFYGAYIAALIAFTCAIIIPAVSHMMPLRSAMIASFVLLASAGALLLRQPTIQRLWISGVPFGVGAGVIYCLSIGRITECTEPSKQGKLAGMSLSISSLAFLVAGVAMGGAVGSERLSSAMIPVVAGIGVLLCAADGPWYQRCPEPTPSPAA